MGSLPEAFPQSVRETALTLLAEAEAAGYSKSRACQMVAAEFTDGPKFSTLMGWATAAKLFTKMPSAQGYKAYDDAFRARAVDRVRTVLADGVSLYAAITQVTAEPGMPSPPTLRSWFNRLAGDYEVELSEVAVETEVLPDVVVEDVAVAEPPQVADEIAGTQRVDLGEFAAQLTKPLNAIIEDLEGQNAGLRQDVSSLTTMNARLSSEANALRALARHYVAASAS